MCSESFDEDDGDYPCNFSNVIFSLSFHLLCLLIVLCTTFCKFPLEAWGKMVKKILNKKKGNNINNDDDDDDTKKKKKKSNDATLKKRLIYLSPWYWVLLCPSTAKMSKKELPIIWIYKDWKVGIVCNIFQSSASPSSSPERRRRRRWRNEPNWM